VYSRTRPRGRLLPALGLAACLALPLHAAGAQDDGAVRLYYSGNGLLSRGMNDLAVAEYRAFLEAAPDHEKADVARYGLAVALSRMGRHAEVVEALGDLRDPDTFEFAPEASVVLGQSLMALGRFGDAVGVLGAMVESHPAHAAADEACALVAEANYRDGQFDDAALAAEALVQVWPDSPMRDRAEFFWALSDMAMERYADAAGRFEALLEREPEGPFARQSSVLLANCLERAGLLDRALRQYRRAAGAAADELTADALVGFGGVLLRTGAASEAAQVLDRSISNYPQHTSAPRALLLRGRAAFDLENYPEAASYLGRALERMDGDSDEAAYWLAKTRLRQGQPADAAAGLREALDRFPESALRPEMIYDLAVALVRDQQRSTARETLSRFRDRYADHALEADATRLLASLAHQDGDYDESAALCAAWLAEHAGDPGDTEVAFLNAENALLTGDIETAADRYSAFLDDHPDASQAPTAAFRLGDALWRLDRPEEARPMLERVARGQRTATAHRPALRLLGEIAFNAGDYDAAEERFGEYLAFGLDQHAADDVLLKQALCAQRDGRPEECIARCDQLLDAFPDSERRIQAIFERGQARMTLGQTDLAQADLEAVVNEAPDSRFAPYALNHLGAIALEAGDYELAAERFDAASAGGADVQGEALARRGQALLAGGDYEAALATFDQVLETDGPAARQGEAAAGRAVALARLGRHDDAIDAVETALDDHAGSIAPAMRDTLAYERARALRDSGDADAAREAYGALLQDEPDDSLAVFAMADLAQLESDAGAPDRALALLSMAERAIDGGAAAPDSLRERVAYNHAAARYRLNQHEEAAQRFGAFRRDFPESDLSSSAALLEGESLFRIGRYGEAASLLEQVVEQDLDDASLSPALLRLGESLAQRQDWAASEAAFQRWLDRFDDDAGWHQATFGVGWARENRQEYDDAVAAYRQVVARHEGPTAARSQFQIGECLFAQGRHEEAVRELLKVDILYAYPEWSAAALYEAGRCFEAMGRRDEARRQYQTVVGSHAGTRWADLAGERLAALGG
jgi:TolA-binding protein